MEIQEKTEIGTSKIGKRHGTDFCSEPPEKIDSVCTLISHFWPPKV